MLRWGNLPQWYSCEVSVIFLRILCYFNGHVNPRAEREMYEPSSRYASPGASKAPGGAATASKSLNMQAYELVKHRILTLQFRPGACLNEAHLSQLLNIGRTPIHQALNRLTLQGMVQVIPRKGVIVKSISMDEVMENIDVRLANEMCCARLAALHRDDRDIAEMKRILADARTELPAQNIERQMILDHDFRQAISTAAKNKMLTDILSHLHDQSCDSGSSQYGNASIMRRFRMSTRQSSTRSLRRTRMRRAK